MRLLVDVNLSTKWVEYLSAHGHEAAHWSSLGNPSAKDAEILEHAAKHGYVILTHDLDFGALLAQATSQYPSVVQLRCQDPMPDTAGPTLIAALKTAEEYILSGALVSVDDRQHRIRILPIRS